MHFVFKGKMKSEDQLDKGVLPPNAVAFREPQNMRDMNLALCAVVIPCLLLVVIIVILRNIIHGGGWFPLNLWGVLLSLLMIFPHELLHAVAFPKDATVEIWYNLKSGMAFCMSTCPVTKARFIFLSLLPNLLFGVLPLVLWVCIPFESTLASNTLFTFGASSFLMGCGDYLNVYNASRQMPKGTMTQLSGFHSYWYYPQK